MIRFLLWIARQLPKGGPFCTRWLARFFPSLQRYPVVLRMLPGRNYYIDLRESVFYPLYKFGSYPHQDGEDLVARHILRPGDIVYDVGANIGYTTLLFSDVVQNGHVYAFEPSRKCVHYLRDNLQKYNNISLIAKAVSCKEGHVSFSEQAFLDRSGIASSDIVQEANAETSLYEVESISLDGFFSQHPQRPIFIKIDVEGHEQQVFEGAKEVLRTCKPFLMFEALHTDSFEQNRSYLTEVTEGAYAYFRIMPNGLLSSGEASEGPHNYLACPDWGRERISGLCKK